MKTEKYHPLPQPDQVPTREREDAMGAYLMMFASIAAGLPLPILNLIAATIYYFVNRSKSRFVEFHSFQSVISQIPVSLINVIAASWFISIIFGNRIPEFPDNFKGYVLMALVVNVLYMGFSIYAAVRARKGRFFYFVFFGKISYQRAYLVKEAKDNQDPVNKPPSL